MAITFQRKKINKENKATALHMATSSWGTAAVGFRAECFQWSSLRCLAMAAGSAAASQDTGKCQRCDERLSQHALMDQIKGRKQVESLPKLQL